MAGHVKKQHEHTGEYAAKYNNDEHQILYEEEDKHAQSTEDVSHDSLF